MLASLSRLALRQTSVILVRRTQPVFRRPFPALVLKREFSTPVEQKDKENLPAKPELHWRRDFPQWIKTVPGTVVETGSKLLAHNIRIASNLAWATVNGRTLTWREHRMLTRTVADIFRLVPFIIIIIVPFMEFALPFILRFFPNMLPSTFEDKLQKQEALKKKLQLRLKMAKFLQETLEEMASHNVDSANIKGFQDFMKKVRNGEYVSNTEILQFAQLFRNEFTLDNLPRPQLVAIAKYMQLPAYGPDAFLRFAVRNKLKQIERDDVLMAKQGVDTFTDEELGVAMRLRGMTSEMTRGQQRRALKNWLDLTVDKTLPSSLLILSRAFTITGRETEAPAVALKNTIGALPDELVEDAIGSTGETIEETKLEQLKREEELIKEEAQLAQVAKPTVPKDEKEAKKIQKDVEEALEEVPEDKKSAIVQEVKEDEEEERLRNQISMLSKALEVLGSESSVSAERSETAEIASNIPAVKAEDTPAVRLAQRLNKSLAKLQDEVEKVDKTIGSSLRVMIDADKDGLFSPDEIEVALQHLKLKLSEVEKRRLVGAIDADKDGKVSLEDLRKMASVEEDAKDEEKKKV